MRHTPITDETYREGDLLICVAVVVPPALSLLSHVLVVRALTEMCRITAAWVVTTVENQHPRLDLLVIPKDVCDPVGVEQRTVY